MIKWLLVTFLIGMALLLWRSTAFANSNLPKAGAQAPGIRRAIRGKSSTI